MPRDWIVKGMAAVGLALMPASLSATAVVLFRTPERVVLAADSRESIYNERGERYAFKETCKLRRAGRWFVAWGALEAVHERNLLATFVDELRSVERFADITPTSAAAALDSCRGICNRRICRRSFRSCSSTRASRAGISTSVSTAPGASSRRRPFADQNMLTVMECCV